MKYLISLMLCVFSTLSFASSITEEEAQTNIVGQWQLISYVDRAGDKTDYTARNIIWSFDGERYSVESDDLGGKYQDDYEMLRSKYKLFRTIIILSDALQQTHLPHGKFVVQSIENDVLILVDWNDKVTYTLNRQ